MFDTGKPMEDKKIKQISRDMFIAWGIISWLVLILDLKFWHLGMSVLYTSHADVSALPRYVPSLFLFLNISCTIPIVVIGIWITLGIIDEFLIYFSFIPQIIFYWYLGTLTGIFIVWIRHKVNKKLRNITPEQE